MAYYMNYKHQSIASPSITSLPNYVRCLMHTGINDITIDIGDMDKALFNALIDEIRLYFLSSNSKYKHIITSSDGELTNPYFFHIPSEDETTISFTEHEDKLEIHKANINDVVKYKG